MTGIKTLDLGDAASQIKQACRTQDSPFFFVVGAGISSPQVLLAAGIEELCKRKARKLGRRDRPPSNDPIDTYSHWFSRAYPSLSERQRYLHRLIEGKRISDANLRLAHLLLKRKIARLIITTNFDNFLARALTLFGEPYIVYDQPEAIGQIDPERLDIQIVQVHGSYRFYECANLREEILRLAQGSAGSPSRMAAFVQRVLSRRSPIVVGYSGWEGDVIMAALKDRLDAGYLPHNLYWFCYEPTSISQLPDWLKQHPNVFFVTPSLQQKNNQRAWGATMNLKSLEPVGSPQRIVEPKKIWLPEGSQPTLPAHKAFDGLIQAFNLQPPAITIDPLGFVIEELRKSLPQGDTDGEEDFYSLGKIVPRFERAKRLDEEDTSRSIGTKLDQMRNALRRSQYRESIGAVKNVDLSKVTKADKIDLMTSLWAAATNLSDNSKEELAAYDLIVRIGSSMPITGMSPRVKLAFARAMTNRAIAFGELGKLQPAVEAYDEVIRHFRGATDRALAEALAMALVNKGVMLEGLGRHADAVRSYDVLIRRFGKSRYAPLRGGIARALFNKAVTLRKLGRERDSLDVYEDLVKRFSKTSDRVTAEILATGLINKGYTHGLFSQARQEIDSYNQVVKRFGKATESVFRLLVAKALLNKSVALVRSNKTKDAIRVCDDFLTRFGRANEPALQDLLAQILINKSLALYRRSEPTDAIGCLDEVERQFGASTLAALQRSVAMALVVKGNQIGDADSATNIYADVIARYSSSSDPGVREQVGFALINRGINLVKLGKNREAITSLRKISRNLHGLGGPYGQLLPARALAIKAGALISLGRYKRAIEILDSTLSQLADSRNPELLTEFVVALLNKGIAHYKAKQHELALKSFDDVFEKFGKLREQEVRELVVKALRFKIAILVERREDAKPFYREVSKRTQKAPTLMMRGDMPFILNSVAFQAILEAKKEWQQGNQARARRSLAEAQGLLANALGYQPQPNLRAFILGNIGYINFLHGDKIKARKALTEAIKLGGETLRRAELRDARMHPLPLDKQFREFVNSVSAPSVLKR